MAETLNIDLALVILIGILSGILPAYVGFRYSERMNNKLNILPPIFFEKNQRIMT